MAYTASKLIEIATAEIGYHEKASNANLDSKTANSGNKNFTKYGRDLFKAGFFNGNGSGNSALSKYFTVETLGDKYIKLTPIASTSGTYSKLVETVASSSNARFVRFSLKGTGENLIITLDEPIE